MPTILNRMQLRLSALLQGSVDKILAPRLCGQGSQDADKRLVRVSHSYLTHTCPYAALAARFSRIERVGRTSFAIHQDARLVDFTLFEGHLRLVGVLVGLICDKAVIEQEQVKKHLKRICRF